MKTLKLFSLAIALILANTAIAQISVNVNFGPPPLWGPVGYNEVRYYYLPDVEAYYDTRSTMFIYYGNGRWNRGASLPRRYRNYDLYSGYKVVMSGYHGETPYDNFNEHKMKYARGYRGEMQRTVGERPEKRSSNTRSKSRGEDKGQSRDIERGKHKDR